MSETETRKRSARTEQKAAAPAQPAARRTQAERTALSDGRLLEAATRMLAHSGYRATSLAAIAEDAGYSAGLVNHRFGSKEGLVRAVAQHLMRTWTDQQERQKVARKAGMPGLLALLRAHRQMMRDHPDQLRALYRVIFELHGELSGLKGELASFDRAARAQVRAFLAHEQAQGRLRAGIDESSASTLVLAMIRGLVMQWMLDPEDTDLERSYDELERLVKRWLIR